MSGLSSFFREFLSCPSRSESSSGRLTSTTTATRTAATEEQVNQKEQALFLEGNSNDYHYHQSISATINRINRNGEVELEGGEKFNNDDDYKIITATQGGENEQEEDEADGDILQEEIGDVSSKGLVRISTYQEWKHMKKQLLYDYLDQRLIRSNPSDNEEEEGGEGNQLVQPGINSARNQEGQHGDDNEVDEVADSQLETQPNEHGTMFDIRAIPASRGGLDGDDGDEDKRNDTTTTSIHVDDTMHSVQYIADIDLHCKEATLDVCQLTHVWSLRCTNRGKKRKRPATTTRDYPGRSAHWYTSAPYLPRIEWDYEEEDGPLSLCYRDVISLEVQQIHPSHSELRTRTELLQEVTEPHYVSKRRIKIFLYSSYAITINQLIQNCPPHCMVVISFQHIPAKCIMPYSVSDWYDGQSCCSFCFTIGDDNNSMKIDSIEGGSERLRFDDTNMTIFVAYRDKERNSTGGYYGGKAVGVGGNFQPHCFRIEMDPNTSGSLRVSKNMPIDETPFAAYSNEVSAVALRNTNTRQSTGTEHYQGQNLGSRPREVAAGEAQQVDKDATNAALLPIGNSAPLAGASSSIGSPDRHQHRTMGGRRCDPATSPTARWIIHGAHGQSPQQVPPASPGHEIMEYDVLNDLKSIYTTHRAVAMRNDNGTSESCLVNLVCVVLGFTPGALTKGGDWMMAVSLIDDSIRLLECESVDDPVVSININIFVKSKADLPRIRYAGDVVRLHRVKLQEWNEDLQLMGMRKSSYVVVRGNLSDPEATENWTVVPTAKAEFAMDARDRRRLIHLWQWGQKRIYEHATLRLTHRLQLSYMLNYDIPTMVDRPDKVNSWDATVMVAAIVPVPPDKISGSSPRGFLRVWDGTGSPHSDPFPIDIAQSVAATAAISNGDPPTEALIRIASVMKRLVGARRNSFDPPRALTGCVVNVAVWESPHWEVVQQVVHVGSFIRLRNINVNLYGDLRCLHIHSKSHLTPLPDLTYEVIRLLEDHHNRLLRKEPINSSSGLLPLDDYQADHPGTPVNLSPIAPSQPEDCNTLAALLEGGVPTVFRGIVRIIDIFPSLQDLLKLNGMDAICISSPDGQFSYRFVVNLGDGTSAVDAILGGSGELGKVILGMSAADALRRPGVAVDHVRRILANDGTRWSAKIRSIAYQGAKYFLLDGLEENR